jgi:2-amino-1-hydroxyethylphosphonate dioxygenase (glycine-forming)
MNTIADLFAQSGAEAYYGEPVTQLEHALQCAHLAEQAGAEPAVVVAAFLHDIGHMLPIADELDYMDTYGTVDHEGMGADYLRDLGFPERVAELIENHVNAKRYLVAAEPGYAKKLSEASRKTLAFQGGPMDAYEVRKFRQHPDFELILQLRRWDEQAKIPGLPTPDATHYLAMAEAVRT